MLKMIAVRVAVPRQKTLLFHYLFTNISTYRVKNPNIIVIEITQHYKNNIIKNKQ
ncbi:hypothetical protein O3M35_011291 [Rhynocoris fuscipes]|uniref:Uncharacterized protein n=1 Tax=Rhynocoris fuscipes TaxID=488301 RepID=A0AAW1CW13_9HEMI